MQIALLYAMEKEARGLLARYEAAEAEFFAGMPVYRLSPQVVLCIGGVGKVNAAMAAQMLIDRFGVEHIINVGCAGALAELPTGALVLGTDCVQHDVDTTLAGDPPGLVSTVNCVRFPCTGAEMAAAALERAGYAAVKGTVATGDWFGRDYDRAAAIRDTYGALVCEMEACAAAQVCLRNEVPFSALKVVSDHLFAARQEEEYAANVGDVMEKLNGALCVCLKEMEE